MQVISTDTDLFDRFEFVIDEDAEPGDFDEAVATFLLAYIETESATPGEVLTEGQLTTGATADRIGGAGPSVHLEPAPNHKQP